MKMVKEFILPTSLLAGTVIGAGIFSLPYVFVESGVGLGFALLAGFAAVFCLVHLMYGDLSVVHGDDHRFAGFARIYFGRFGHWLAVVMTIVEMFFVLTIYLVLSVSFVRLIAPSLPAFWEVAGFWLLGSVIIFSGTRRIALFEFLAVGGIAAAILVVAWYGLPGFFHDSISFSFGSWQQWLLPFGALLFSLSGRPAVPSVVHYFRRIGAPVEKSKPVIIWGTIIPALVYALFVAGVLGVSGVVTADAVTGMASALPRVVAAVLLGGLGLLSLISSYFSIGLDVRNSLIFDLKLSRVFSAVLVLFLPILIYLLDIGSFLTLVELAGGLFIGFEGIMILLMWRKAHKQGAPLVLLRSIPGLLYWLMFAVFAVSIGYVVASRII